MMSQKMSQEQERFSDFEEIMPAYINNPQAVQVTALYKGNAKTLVNNAATDSAITKTIQFAVGPEPGSGSVTLTVYNQTNQQATGEWTPSENYSPSVTQPTYEPLSGCIVPAGSTLPYNLSGGWVCFTFATAPTTGS